MASPVFRETVERDRFNGTLGEYFIFHVKRFAPEEILVDTVRASTEAEARVIAKRQFPVSTILNIRGNANTLKGSQIDGYPSARFIKGKFHAATFTDESMLPEHID